MLKITRSLVFKVVCLDFEVYWRNRQQKAFRWLHHSTCSPASKVTKSVFGLRLWISFLGFIFALTSLWRFLRRNFVLISFALRKKLKRDGSRNLIKNAISFLLYTLDEEEELVDTFRLWGLADDVARIIDILSTHMRFNRKRNQSHDSDDFPPLPDVH